MGCHSLGGVSLWLLYGQTWACAGSRQIPPTATQHSCEIRDRMAPTGTGTGFHLALRQTSGVSEFLFPNLMVPSRLSPIQCLGELSAMGSPALHRFLIQRAKGHQVSLVTGSFRELVLTLATRVANPISQPRHLRLACTACLGAKTCSFCRTAAG